LSQLKKDVIENWFIKCWGRGR